MSPEKVDSCSKCGNARYWGIVTLPTMGLQPISLLPGSSSTDRSLSEARRIVCVFCRHADNVARAFTEGKAEAAVVDVMLREFEQDRTSEKGKEYLQFDKAVIDQLIGAFPAMVAKAKRNQQGKPTPLAQHSSKRAQKSLLTTVFSSSQQFCTKCGIGRSRAHYISSGSELHVLCIACRFESMIVRAFYEEKGEDAVVTEVFTACKNERDRIVKDSQETFSSAEVKEIGRSLDGSIAREMYARGLMDENSDDEINAEESESRQRKGTTNKQQKRGRSPDNEPIGIGAAKDTRSMPSDGVFCRPTHEPTHQAKRMKASPHGLTGLREDEHCIALESLFRSLPRTGMSDARRDEAQVNPVSPDPACSGANSQSSAGQTTQGTKAPLSENKTDGAKTRDLQANHLPINSAASYLNKTKSKKAAPSATSNQPTAFSSAQRQVELQNLLDSHRSRSRNNATLLTGVLDDLRVATERIDAVHTNIAGQRHRLETHIRDSQKNDLQTENALLNAAMINTELTATWRHCRERGIAELEMKPEESAVLLELRGQHKALQSRL